MLFLPLACEDDWPYWKRRIAAARKGTCTIKGVTASLGFSNKFPIWQKLNLSKAELNFKARF